MNISQSWTGEYSHAPHVSGVPCDFPIDEAGEDAYRSWMHCPCDEMVVKRISGLGSAYINTIWLQSTSKVILANGEEDYVVIMVLHPDDDDLLKVKVGRTFKRSELMFREGRDGYLTGKATGYHFHMSVGQGQIKGNGWQQNSKGTYVLTTTVGPLKPEDAFFVDPYFTKIKSSKDLLFKNLPKEVIEVKEIGKEVVIDQPAEWAKISWNKAAVKKILDGTRPGEQLTRQEFACVLDRLGLLN
jgi:hypothetical protein